MSRTRPARIQRWMDLLAALLGRRFTVTSEELFREVPGYADACSVGARERMFERDKEGLRALGILIETMSDEDGRPGGYRLRRRDFYLPYLVVKRSGAESGLAERPGYRDLPRVVLEPDELAVIDAAALLVHCLGDPALVADIESAMRKLAFDLPPGTFASGPGGAGGRRGDCQSLPV